MKPVLINRFSIFYHLSLLSDVINHDKKYLLVSILLIGFFILVPPAFAKGKKAKAASGTSETAKSFGEGVDQIGADVVDTIVEEVTGKKTTVTKTTSAKGALHPGVPACARTAGL